ncbi:MAG: MaoC family dehydratase N-terminal domain-containing protein, partial [Chloroflexi bacterium]|nr:MaoC family dehydratase N-terminal domain-containing protein [Chloroflexota bacterium]
MTRQTEQQRVTETLPEVESISPEAIAKAKAMIGMRLRTENFTRDASVGALLNFVNGIGDANPIFRDQEYAAYSKYGSIIGHPCAPYMRHWSGRTRWGLPGVHGFFAGNDWEFFRHLRPGDAINCIERVLDVQEKQSQYSATLVIQFVETIYTNQRDELVARVVGWCTRHQRRASRERGKYADVPRRHEYTPEELEEIDQLVLNEKARGGDTRYFEDTNIGDELEPVVRGPLSLQDVSAFLVGTGRSSAHGVLLREALRHPDHFFRNPEAGGGLEYTGIGHMRDSVAEAVGVPGAYDYGPQRVSWMGTLVTNWMGDDAFLKRLRVECRR